MAGMIEVREARSDPKRWLALVALVAAVLVLGLDMTILVTALPTISTRLGANESDLQWITGAYTLAMSVLLIPAGVLGDRIGRKKTLLAGLLLFGAGSVVASQVTTAEQLIWMRAMMGVGAAIIMPLSMSILPSMFSDEERPRAVMIVTASVMLGLPLGPLVSGWLLTRFDWGSIFLINAPFVVAGMLSVGFLVPETRDPQARRLDWLGAVLLIVGMTALVYGIIEQPVQGWGDWHVWGAGLGGIVLLAAFVVWEPLARAPLIDLRLFTRPRFLWGTVAFTIVGFAMMGVLFVITPYFQSVQGASAQGTGFRLLPMIGGLLVGGLVSERLGKRFGAKLVVATGLLLMALGLVILSRIGADTGFTIAGVALAVIGVGLGFGMPAAMDAVLGALPMEQVGAGSGISRSIQNLASTMGPAILGSILANTYGADLEPRLHGLPEAASSVARGSVSGARRRRGQAAAPDRQAARAGGGCRLYERDGRGAPRLGGRRGRRRRARAPLPPLAGLEDGGSGGMTTGIAPLAELQEAGWIADNRVMPPRLVPAESRPEGLRERKKRRTRLSIQRVALDLFEKQGFDATTIDQIAEAADISPSTFFNYFPSKEDAVGFDECDPILFEDIRSRPPDESPFRKLRHVMVEAAVPLFERDRELVLQRMRIAFREPALRARMWQETDDQLSLLATVVAGPDDQPDDYRLRLVVRMVASVAFEALAEWARQDGKADGRALMEEAFELLGHGFDTTG